MPINKDTIFVSTDQIYMACGFDLWEPEFADRINTYRVSRVFHQLGFITLELMRDDSYVFLERLPDVARKYISYSSIEDFCKENHKRFNDYFLGFSDDFY